MLTPIRMRDQIGQLKREISRSFYIGEDEVNAVAPCVLGQDIFAKIVAETRGGAEEMFDETWNFRFREFAKANGIGKKNRDDACGESVISAVIDRRYSLVGSTESRPTGISSS